MISKAQGNNRGHQKAGAYVLHTFLASGKNHLAKKYVEIIQAHFSAHPHKTDLAKKICRLNDINFFVET
jgi:hypothetical protein